MRMDRDSHVRSRLSANAVARLAAEQMLARSIDATCALPSTRSRRVAELAKAFEDVAISDDATRSHSGVSKRLAAIGRSGRRRALAQALAATQGRDEEGSEADDDDSDDDGCDDGEDRGSESSTGTPDAAVSA
jgi:hypothetical protein